MIPRSLSRFRDREETRRGRETEKEERTRYTPPRSRQTWYPRFGRHRAPVTALRPIGEFCRGRKDAIAKRCRSSPPPTRCSASPSRPFADPTPRDGPCANFFGRSRDPPGNPSRTSLPSAARFAAASRSTTMIGRALSRSAAAVSDRPARAALTRHTLHNSSRATSPSKTA